MWMGLKRIGTAGLIYNIEDRNDILPNLANWALMWSANVVSHIEGRMNLSRLRKFED